MDYEFIVGLPSNIEVGLRTIKSSVCKMSNLHPGSVLKSMLSGPIPDLDSLKQGRSHKFVQGGLLFSSDFTVPWRGG